MLILYLYTVEENYLLRNFFMLVCGFIFVDNKIPMESFYKSLFYDSVKQILQIVLKNCFCFKLDWIFKSFKLFLISTTFKQYRAIKELKLVKVFLICNFTVGKMNVLMLSETYYLHCILFITVKLPWWKIVFIKYSISFKRLEFNYSFVTRRWLQVFFPSYWYYRFTWRQSLFMVI